VANPVHELLAWFSGKGVRVNSLAVDSRQIAAGDVFLAYPGASSDGRRFIGEAINSGAAAVLWDSSDFELDDACGVPHRPVKGLRELAGLLAHEVYGRPSDTLWTMGVTGTNGKTSCSQWIAQACGRVGARTAVMGTLGYGFPALAEDDIAPLEPLANTTPEAVSVHRILANLLRDGAQGAVMEVSSIGLDQGRVNGVNFGAALFTNLSRDHLDYHVDMETYARAKQRLFEFPGLKHAIVNLDDVQGVRIARMLAGSGVNRCGYSCVEGVAAAAGLECFVQTGAIEHLPEGMAFKVTSSWGEARIESGMVGRFNVANLAGVLGTMLCSGVPFDCAIDALSQLRPVPGRMLRLGGMGKPLVVVDYAHTPDALEQTLETLKEVAHARGGKLVAVFGCGGERDRGKRPLMGAVAARHAERVVLTSDNPRGEEPMAIIGDIVEGLSVSHEIIVDRREAIARVVGEARASDVVLLAGKGHENYQEIGGSRLPFSDTDEALSALGAWQP
jgi:UDP-N-acetylmuramoyl-L-alanyl-D-glutamate--2,6-diaminopimelate ligase